MFAVAPDKAGSINYIDLVSTFAVSSFFLYLASATQPVAGRRHGGGRQRALFRRTYIDAEQPSYALYALEINLICLIVSPCWRAALWSWYARIRERRAESKREEATRRRHEMWPVSTNPCWLAAGRGAAPAPIRNGRAYLTIGPPIP